jgi:hypothetical protein
MQNDGATWWSLNDTLFWIAKSNTSSSSEEALDRLCDRRYFDDAEFFSALAELVAALQIGEISAHASIDTAPVAPVATPFWSSTDFIPRWDDLLSPWTPIWPEILILSEKTFRAEALLDHSEPSHLQIADAASPNGKPGFYRVTTDVMLYRDDVFKLWPSNGATESVAKRPSKSRKQRDLTLKVAKSMTMTMTYKGLSLAESKQDLSYAKIADMLLARWDDEGEARVYEHDAVKKSVERYYKRNALPPESGLPGH